MMRRLLDRAAIVTGAGGGIGRAIAELFAANGARVVVADVNEAGAKEVVESIRSSGGEAIAIPTDLGHAESIAALVAGAVAEYGRLDVLINNAAATHLAGRDRGLLDIEPDVWEETIRVNLTGAMLTSQHAVRHMLERGGGSLVHVASAAALRGDDGLTAYSASKAGLIGLSRQIAVQYGTRGVRSNVIAPGLTKTPGSSGASENPAVREVMTAATMANRFGTASEQAAAALFLASDEASFVTGTVLPVDGGLTAVQAWVPGMRHVVSSLLAEST